MPAKSMPFLFGFSAIDARVVERVLRGQIAGDLRPRLAEIGGLEDVGIAVVHQVRIGADVGRARHRNATARSLRSPACWACPVMFFVTSFQCAPASRVYQTLPSLVPAQIRPFWISEGAMANTTSP